MTDARLYAATARTKTPLERADSGRRQTTVLTPEGVTSIARAVQQCEQWPDGRALMDQLRRHGRS